MRWVHCVMAALVMVAGASTGGFAQTPQKEIVYSAAEFKKLDTFEAHSLSKADKVFDKKDYKRAAAEYDSFILEFSKSKAIPFALLRKGRCLHLLKKRFEAIKEYSEVLDYFPNAVKYAAPALYHQGLAHWENGDEEKAMKAWAELARDAEYAKTRLAAPAITRLADNLNKQGKRDIAVKYWKQVAVDFRTVKGAEPNAYHAIGRVIPHYIRTLPDQAKLLEFYKTVRAFHSTAHPAVIADQKQFDADYWTQLISNVNGNGSFSALQKDQRDVYYRYWAGQMTGKFPDWDKYQIQLADYQRIYEQDTVAWAKRLDAQFARGFKTGDFSRITDWIVLFQSHKQKVDQYYARYDFTKMTNPQIDKLMQTMYGKVGNRDLGRSVYNKIRFDQLNDSGKYDVERFLWPYEEKLVEDTCAMFKDQDYGHMETLRFYAYSDNTKKGLPLADRMVKVPKYANESILIKAKMLHGLGKFVEAIAAYKQFTPAAPIQNLYPIAECYRSLGRLNQAIAQLQEVEQFFKTHASEAALKIAYYYNSAGIKQKYVASLYGVMDKYPKSSQSSVAHDALEKLGYRTGGAVKKAD